MDLSTHDHPPIGGIFLFLESKETSDDCFSRIKNKAHLLKMSFVLLLRELNPQPRGWGNFHLPLG